MKKTLLLNKIKEWNSEEKDKLKEELERAIKIKNYYIEFVNGCAVLDMSDIWVKIDLETSKIYNYMDIIKFNSWTLYISELEVLLDDNNEVIISTVLKIIDYKN